MPLRFEPPAAQAYPFPLTIGHLLDSALRSNGHQEIVYRDCWRMTYRVLRQRIGRLAAMLAGLGADAGTTVAVMDWDSHRYLEAYFAVPMMGAVLQTVNIRLPRDQIAYTLDHADAEILIVHHDFLSVVEEILPRLSRVRAVVAIADGHSEAALPVFAVGEYEALIDEADEDFPFEDFDENAVATVFYTSGTTGNPKGVFFTHRQLVIHTLVTCSPSGLTQTGGISLDSVYMPLTPMFHVHAWGMPYVATMLGLKQVYPGRYDSDLICDLRTREGVTYSHGVPTVLQMLIDAADRTGTDLTGWTMGIGGSALTPALYEAGGRRGMKLVGGYGMSETGPTASVSRRKRDRAGEQIEELAAMTGAGIAAPLVSARIVDEEMRELPADGVARGELVLRAPWLTSGYLGNEEASNALWRGGWLHTQDVATIDPDGFITICDRLKDVIKTGGEWVGSLDIERLTATVKGVAEVAVIGMPDERWGERPLAVVVAAADGPPSLAALNEPIAAAAASGAISPYAKLDRLEIVSALPRTSVGKIDKKLLRTRLLQGEPLDGGA